MGRVPYDIVHPYNVTLLKPLQLPQLLSLRVARRLLRKGLIVQDERI